MQENFFTELMQKSEPLCDELAMYYSHPEGGIPSVQHPLVYSVMHHEQMNAMVNYRLKMKQEMLDRLLSEGGKDCINNVVYLYERPWRLQGFIDHALGKVHGADYWRLLSSVWQDSENIWQNLSLWHELLFDSKERTRHAFMTTKERKALAAMPDTLTVYRGVRNRHHWRGFSWTLDGKKAEWFAARYGSNQKAVVTGTVNKADVLAYLTGRGESEIVVDYAKVKTGMR